MRQLANITVEIKRCDIALKWYLVCYLRATSCLDLSNFVGISPSVKFFSQNSNGFINIHEYYDLVILKVDHLLNIILS